MMSPQEWARLAKILGLISVASSVTLGVLVALDLVSVIWLWAMPFFGSVLGGGVLAVRVVRRTRRSAPRDLNAPV